MPACSICLEPFNNPVSLPCGHVFCRECVHRTVAATKTVTIQHFCPACRAPYPILTVDPALIPPFLRPHIQPPIRKLFFNDDPPPPTLNPTATAADLGRALAEVTVLREHCATWRRRAEVHAAGNTTLLGLTRAAKDCALRMRAERDAERSQCVLLKRKLAELMPGCCPSPSPPNSSPPSHSDSDSDYSDSAKRKRVVVPPPPCGPPVFLMQTRCATDFYDNPADLESSHFGPPLKRRRRDDEVAVKQEEVVVVKQEEVDAEELKLTPGCEPSIFVLPADAPKTRLPDVTALPLCDSIFVSRPPTTTTLVSAPR